ncbi:hypothetical protein LIER_41415 [Lithospermum erythrorhizon]|uniref:Gag-pol polyprotein n=1 Tax=Lithospermum erythrorhizon TaxID=34254 RepID=A0AAV3RD49_LITER
MENFKEGGSISRPPLLDRSNYSYWKAKMTAFLLSIDTKTWKVVKPEADWTREENQASLSNHKDLRNLINTCIVAKISCETLETTYAGT